MVITLICETIYIIESDIINVCSAARHIQTPLGNYIILSYINYCITVCGYNAFGYIVEYW